jgi:hypothetical protein
MILDFRPWSSKERNGESKSRILIEKGFLLFFYAAQEREAIYGIGIPNLFFGKSPNGAAQQTGRCQGDRFPGGGPFL